MRLRLVALVLASASLLAAVVILSGTTEPNCTPIPLEPPCVAEGESFGVGPNAPECCPGLQPVGCQEGSVDGSCDMCVGASFCTDCGDGECGPGENFCRCPEDCPYEPPCASEGESVPVVPGAPQCCDGLVNVPCDSQDPSGACVPCDGASFCTFCGDGNCGLGENPCNCPDDCYYEPPCVNEGGIVPVVPGAPQCCDGLVNVSCASPEPSGMCMPCDGATICTFCGDGNCGPGENPCNCPDDCIPVLPCAGEGEIVPVVPGAPPCCDGLVQAPLFDLSDPTMGCVPMDGASVCILCPNGQCGPGEDPCNCPPDCAAAP